jgi:hypothetical protein
MTVEVGAVLSFSIELNSTVQPVDNLGDEYDIQSNPLHVYKCSLGDIMILYTVQPDDSVDI